MLELRNEASIQDLLSEAQRRRRERKHFHRSCVVGRKGAWRKVSNTVKSLFFPFFLLLASQSRLFGSDTHLEEEMGVLKQHFRFDFVVVLFSFHFFLRFSHGSCSNGVSIAFIMFRSFPLSHSSPPLIPKLLCFHHLMSALRSTSSSFSSPSLSWSRA